ncbi:MAG: ion transporter [Mogibacterium sp.]|nr:ion transporter [Mogibacterium sp.]
MVSIGVTDSRLNRSYDIISTLALVVNLVAAFASTFEELRDQHGALLHWIELITVLFFAIDYVLRIISAAQQYPESTQAAAVRKYALSGYGIIDLLSFLPFYLPAFFPAGAAVFRMFRVVRIFRLFRINAYSDSLTLIGNVLKNKKTQILASVFIVVMLILASSLCMYSVEHEAQPEVFKNAFSAIWWATSTLLTVGYGDIYPITFVGQLLGIIITFLGVGLVAIPTGIISAGFIEEYQKATRFADIQQEKDVRFIEISIDEGDTWAGKTISEISMPSGSIIALVLRGKDTIVPRGDVQILLGDKLIVCAESAAEGMLEDVKEIVLRQNHSWNGQKIRDLDISRQTYIVLVDRGGKMLRPHGELVLEENDKLLVFTKENISKYNKAFTI